MNGSITLSQLPYTGFDYGEAYNSGFWVALTLWSLMASIIIVRHRGTWARAFTGLLASRTQESAGNGTYAEPVILTERITPTSERVVERSADTWSSAYAPEVSDETKLHVHRLVEQELAESREGESPEEFSSDDFASVDFDGVNPDEYWEPQPLKPAPPKPIERAVQDVPTPQGSEATYAAAYAAPPRQKRVEPAIPAAPQKSYTDVVTLDRDGEYPKLVLARSEQV